MELKLMYLFSEKKDSLVGYRELKLCRDKRRLRVLQMWTIMPHSCTPVRRKALSFTGGVLLNSYKLIRIVFIIFVSSFFTLLSFQQSFANDTKNCHCFKERTYNKDKKSAADEYMLATSFNSLIATSFNISKQQIVMRKMQGGISQDDLIIGLEIAKKTGISFDKIIKDKENNSWDELISKPEFSFFKKQTPIATKIIKKMIKEYFSISDKHYDKLKNSGHNKKEIALLLILSKKSGIPTDQLSSLYRVSNKTWSEIGHNLGITPKEAGMLFLN